MFGLLRFILKYGAVLLFLVFELIAFYLVINYNQGQKKIFSYSANILSGRILDEYTQLTDYLYLANISDSLARENARLRAEIANKNPATPNLDSSLSFQVIPARVVSNSVTSRNNLFTIDKGSRSGIIPGLGVVGESGPLGIVRHVGKEYSTVLSILHSQSMISVKLKNTNYFGSLVWKGGNPTMAKIQALPKHVNVQQGDSVETSGYSYLFPEGIFVGVVENVELGGGSNFYSVDIRLHQDLANLSYVYVYKNAFRNELDSLNRLIDEQR